MFKLLSIENDNVTQLFFWDNNVVMMEEEDDANYYIQDVLGSPMHLMDMDGNSRESYGYDEFGMPIYNDLWVEQQAPLLNSKNAFRTALQPFGFTGYQMDEAGSLYFAQARRYDAQTGRFVSEDIVKGSIETPFTLNSYSYCWNRPLDFVDLHGKNPESDDGKKILLTVIGISGVIVGLALCSTNPIAII